jgi:anti-sigma factor RsiW
MLPEFLDGSISKDEATVAAEHLATCDQCTAELNELEGVTKLYREHGTMRLPDESRTRIAGSLGISEEL